MLGGLKLALRNARRDESAIDSDDSGDELGPDETHPEARTRRHSSIRQKLTSAVKRHRGSRGSRGSVSQTKPLTAVTPTPDQSGSLRTGTTNTTSTLLTPAATLARQSDDKKRTSISALSSRPENSKTDHSHHSPGPNHRELAEKLVQAERLSATRNLPKFTASCMVNYILVDKLGEGAFSNVYHARDRRTGADVAVKAVRKYELTPPQRASVLKEVQIMRTLKHPSIIQLLDFGESKEYYFLILEWADGGELFERIAALTYLSEPLSRHVITQVAHAVRYLHEEKGVVHRDIKPENLLFDEIEFTPTDPEELQRQREARPYDDGKADEGIFTNGVGGGGIGRVKLADFGLSKVVWEQFTATPCGTAGYTAPEIVKDQRYSKSVDMWALGCVLYTLLCGFPPFYDESIETLTHKVAKGQFEFLSPWWDEISSDAKDLVCHLLTVDPKKRYTIDEFLAHPWCNIAPGGAASTNWSALSVAPAPATKSPAPSIRSVHSITPSVQSSRAERDSAPAGIDSPLLAATRVSRRGMPSPGLTQLREAFDVSYALHRAEEEAQHRKELGYSAQETTLLGLNEEDEEEEEEGVLAQTEARYGPNSDAAQAVRRGSTAATDQRTPRIQVEPTSAKEDAAAERLAQLELDGRNRSSKSGPFELNLGHSTLLGRRNAQHTPQ